MLTTNLVIDPSNSNIVLIYLEFINYDCDMVYKLIGNTLEIFNIIIILNLQPNKNNKNEKIKNINKL